jgi:transcriptional regulator with XRE-family HTH domain
MATFSDLLEHARRAANISSDDLARRLNATPAALTKAFSGERVPAVLIRDLVRELGITRDAVLCAFGDNPADIGEAIVYLWCREIGEHLAALREGVTTASLAKTAGVNESTIRRWERAVSRPSAANLASLLMAYGTKLEELLVLGLWPPAQHPGATSIGDMLREHREGRGLSQAAFARHLGVHKATYRGWETGASQPKGQMKQIVAVELGFPVALIDALHESHERLPRSKPAPFARMLRAHRKAEGLSRKKLAALTGTSEAKISAWEYCDHGHTPETIGVISRVYGLERSQVLPFIGVDPEASFGSWIRAMRISAGLSVHEVAALGGPSRNTSVFIESDRHRPSAAVSLKLASVLNVDPLEMQVRLAKAGAPIQTAFALACQTARATSGDSVKDVAERLGQLTAAIRGLESSRWLPQRARLADFASAYGVSLDDLTRAWESSHESR